MIEYLEELHEHDRATADHTTLLLNCYAKLKDTGKLDSFIKAPGELKFDLETAIAMCRQGGYFEQAAYLATKHGENEMVVDILIEDSKKYAEAVEFIWRLEPEEVRITADVHLIFRSSNLTCSRPILISLNTRGCCYHTARRRRRSCS